MEVAARAMGPVICKLGELLAGEYNLEKRVKKGVQSLRTELEMMHAVLREVGKVPPDQLQEPVRIWAGKVRDLSCDMEDAVDDFLARVGDGSASKPTDMRSRVNKFLKKTTTLFGKGKALHQICDAIKEAQDLAKELAELRKKYELDMRSTSNCATIDPLVLALHKDVGELVGLDHTRDELIKTLICADGSSKEQLKTISIVGVGGLGKTTLTKAVYEKIKTQFDCVAFVPVGQNPDIKKVFKDLLYGLDNEKFSDIHNTTRDENLLIKQISDYLVHKRYLIVIDDIWEEEIWRCIDCALYKNKLHSRVITTTRNVSVSKACLSSSDDTIHKMKPLSDEDSQILFHRRIFRSEEKCPEDLQVVSRDILKKCGGVPLAIITIASLLVSNQRVKPNHDWMDVYNSMGHGVTQSDIAKDMNRILSLSYYDLPSYLKPCLLYLSIFPEDFEIERDFLIWRLSLHNIKAKVQNHQFDSTSLSKVRTFAVFSPVTCDWLPSLSSFQFLRVLDLGNCGSRKSSSGISIKYVGNLIHLRYLGLRSADIDELPMDIGNLHLLQIMDILNTGIEELPASVVQLRNLICLYVDSRVRLPKGMGNLTSLEVLDYVRVSSSPHIVKELSHLTEVRTLEIDWANMDEDLIDVLIKSLGNLHKLQNLCIDNGGRLTDRMSESWVPPPNLRSFDSWDPKLRSSFQRLPKWVNSRSLPLLSTLEIDVEELQGDDIQIIGMLPALRFLRLLVRRVMGTLVVRADAFPSARCCIFRGFPTAPCLFPPGAMPRVQHLRFWVSARSIASGEVDCGLGHLPSLEHVEVRLRHQHSSDKEIETAKAQLRRAAEAHPKRPTIEII
ncbi:unnamed protein product [Triticum turgidum subsp. durum]|uniref:Uncharacterized protein n=1 Tax=Triticum turgidum subsp. durum TaxID=4567 RepID=A0A9R1BVD9_TRITD|nr:unnamed protein product [Triticum turgidum subsp. durum]